MLSAEQGPRQPTGRTENPRRKRATGNVKSIKCSNYLGVNQPWYLLVPRLAIADANELTDTSKMCLAVGHILTASCTRAIRVVSPCHTGTNKSNETARRIANRPLAGRVKLKVLYKNSGHFRCRIGLQLSTFVNSSHFRLQLLLR